MSKDKTIKCADCLHYEACKGTYMNVSEYKSITDFDSEHYADIYHCPDFADKSEWVHLPCKVGDKVYFVDASHYRCDAEDCYCCDNEGDIESKYDRHICEFAKFTPRVVEMKMRNINDIFHWFSYFGKTIFLTREEAEKALAERKEK